MMLKLCVWCLLVCVSLAQDEQPYCSPRYERLCQGKGPHVACQFPYRGHGEACENYTAIVFSNNLKQFVLHYINRRRQRIAAGHERVRGGARLPKPEIMMMVQWDRELAFLAQRLADQCQFVHDDCRATVRYPYAGQTVGEVRWRRSGSLENGARRVIGRVFDAWWGERRRVQPKQLISPFLLTARGAVWGHFSQLAVWTLRAMGCGAVHHGSTRPRLLLVCDFSHTNMLGQRTISPGPLAPCPQHTVRIPKSTYPLLCSSVRTMQAIEDNGRRKEDVEEEEDDDDDDDEEQEQDEKKRGAYITEPINIYSTRPWPNRPVRPIQDILTEKDSQIRDDLEGIEFGQDDITHRESQSINQRYNERLDMESQTISQREDVDGQRYNLKEDLDGQSSKQRYSQKTDMDSQNIQRYSQRGDIDRRYDSLIIDQPLGSIQDTIDTNNQRIRPTYNQDNKRPVRPIQEHIPQTMKEVHHDIKSIKPLQDELIVDSDYRYVRPIEDLTRQNAKRPVTPIIEGDEDNYEDDKSIRREDDNITWRNEIAKTTDRDDRVTMVSVRYRGVPTGREVGKILNKELSSKGKEFASQNRQGSRPEQARRIQPEARNRDAISKNRELESRNRELGPRNKDAVPRNKGPETSNRELGTRNRDQGTRNRDQEMRNKAVHKIDNYRRWEVLRKAEYKARNGYEKNLDLSHRILNQWRDEREREDAIQGVVPLQRYTNTPRRHITTVVVYRPTSLFSISTEPVLRSRFKQTRVRPIRPGANALLHTTTSNLVRRQSKKVSLLLDKDDEEQLYHDTGFKLSTAR